MCSKSAVPKGTCMGEAFIGHKGLGIKIAKNTNVRRLTCRGIIEN